MKTLRLLPVLLLSALCLTAQPSYDQKGRDIVFRNVNVIPMDEEKVLENRTVIVREGRIAAVGDSKTKIPAGALVIEGTGKYLMPGLAEMHAHIPPIDDLEPMKRVLNLFAVNGITTIRGMLGHPRHLQLRQMLKDGEVPGPRFYTTGPSFNGMSVSSPEQGAAMVRKQKEAGYDFLKMHPGLLRAEFDSIATVANALRIPFAGHVSFGVGVWRAIEAGYSSIDHLDGFIEAMVPGIEQMSEQETGPFGVLVADKADQSQIPRLVKALRENNIAVVPTQSLAERWFNHEYTADMFQKDPDARYMDPQTVNQWISGKKNFADNPAFTASKVRSFVDVRRKLIKACHDGGVLLLLGCDAPQVFNVPGFSTHNELQYLVMAGLTPYQALRTGTVNVASYLQIDNGGVVREGAVADLILLNANPLNDINATRKIEGVLIGTSWYAPEYITTTLEQLRNK